MTLLEIHEFSTGIRVQGTPDNWYSTGFTGVYMNATLDPIPTPVGDAIPCPWLSSEDYGDLDPIPTPVRNAIADRLFALASGVSTEDLAVIGREVVGEGGETWAVVAVVTSGRDSKGRYTPLDRYFLTRGSENLGHLVSWMVQQQIQQGKLPVFDPFDTKTLGQPTLYDPSQTRSLTLTEKFRVFLGQEAPIIIPCDRSCSFPILHTIATEKARQKGEPVSWAYNVKELEKPTRFQAIYPASPESQTLFENIKNAPPPPPPSLIQEEEIRRAISDLIDNRTIDPRHLRIFLSSLEKADPQDPRHQEFWQRVLDEEEPYFHSELHAKFLVINAMIFPETLEYALQLLKPGKRSKAHLITFQKFQKDMMNSLQALAKEPNKPRSIAPRLKRGVSLLVARLPQHPEILDATVELLKSEDNLWGYYYPDFVNYLDEQVTEIGSQARRNALENSGTTTVDTSSDYYNFLWKSIFQKISSIWKQIDSVKRPEYLLIARFFHQLSKEKRRRKTSEKVEIITLKQAALFGHIAQGKGKLPKDIPDRLEELNAFQNQPGKADSNCRRVPDNPFLFQVYRVTVEREKDWSGQEKIFSAYIDRNFRSSAIFKLALVFSTVAFLSGIFLKSPVEKGWNSLVIGIREIFYNIASGTCLVRKFVMVPCPPPIDDNFKITRQSLEYLRDEFFVKNYPEIKGRSEQVQKEQFVQEAIERILLNQIPANNRLERLDFNKMTNPIDTWEQERWKTAIRNYQRKVVQLTGEQVNGRIEIPKKQGSASAPTWEVLKCEVARELDLPLTSIPKPCQDVLARVSLPQSIDPKTWEAIKKFRTTKEALEKMIREFQEQEQNIYLIEDAIAKNIFIDNKWLDLLNDDNQRKWVEGIMAYQKTKGLAPDGVINPGQPTYNRLKADVQQQLTVTYP